MKAVEVRDLSYKYQANGPFVLQDINFQVEQGEIIIITGLSGCGKTSLCYCLSGIISHYKDGLQSGEVIINGINIRDLSLSALSLEIGTVFQNPDNQLFSPTVEDEIAFAPENLCLPPDKIRARVEYVIGILGIDNLRNANPCHLSGGEKHLVALAAVLALDPAVLVLDEIMSQLDSVEKKRVVSVLERIRQTGKTIMVVEHDLDSVSYADRIMVIEDGTIMGFDTPAALLADRDFMKARKLACDFYDIGRESDDGLFIAK